MMKMNTLIALVDGSNYAKSVCHYAAWLGIKLQRSVKFYHVLPPHDTDSPQDLSGSIALGARSDLLAELSALDADRAKLTQAKGRAILEDAQSIVAEAGLNVETRLRQGDLLDTVLSKEETGDLILIGKRGEGADMAKGHLGSNLERIIRASHKPVFVANRLFKAPQKALLAFDGGDSAQRAVAYLVETGLLKGIPLTLIYVGKENAAIQAALEQAKAALYNAGVLTDTMIHMGKTEQVLGDLVERESYDLVIMGAYGHSRIRDFLIGSTTSSMIRTCLAPILLFR